MQFVTRFALAPVFALAVLAAGTPARAQDKSKPETEYFPLKDGMRWTYKAGDKSFVVRVEKFEKIGETETARLVTQTTDKEPKTIATENVAVMAVPGEAGRTGVFRVAIEGKEVKPALCFLKLPPKKGESWKFDSKAGEQEIKGTFVSGEEKGVKVPAGPKDGYDTVTVRCENLKVDDQTVSFTYYFAPKVGMVKQVIVSGGVTLTIELEKFEEKK